MPEVEYNKEINCITNIAGDFSRHPRQVNRFMQADAEIIQLPELANEYLVVKTDSIHEEIRENLYEDPYLAGWMAITAPVSDIAAVGGKPTGIVLALIVPQNYSKEWLAHFKRGINEACNKYKIYVLGGDTNFDNHLSVTATAIGLVGKNPLLREGMKPSDKLYATGLFGSGNAYARAKLMNLPDQVHYQPVARLQNNEIIRDFASACIDTSDGFFPALSVLSEINSVGVELTTDLVELLHPSVRKLKDDQLPAWMYMAGPHGEYELLFTIPEATEQKFQVACKSIHWQPIMLGNIIPEHQLIFSSQRKTINCHPSTIANIYFDSGGDIKLYIGLLMHQHHQWNYNAMYESKGV